MKKIIVTLNLDDSNNVCGVNISPDEEEPPPPPILVVSAVSIIPNLVSGTVGDEPIGLISEVRDQLGALMDDEAVIFTSDNPSIATVTQTGDRAATLNLVAAGNTIIRATSVTDNSIVGICSVSVIEPEPDPSVPSRIVISPTDATREEGGLTVQFTASVFDQYDAPMVGVGLNWTTDDSNVATVDANGLVTTVNAGSCKVRVEVAADNAVFDEADLTVTAVSVPLVPTKVVITPSSSTKELGSGNVNITVAVYDQNDDPMPSEDVTLSSLDPSIATVTEPTPNNGVIRPLAVGTARIKATVVSNGISAIHNCTVTPIVLIPTTVIVTPASANGVAGESTQQFTAEVRDQFGNAIVGAGVTWSSDRIDIASVDSSTGLATAISKGTAKIRATASNGVYGEGSYIISDPVTPPPPTPVPSRIVITPASSTIQVGAGNVSASAECFDQFGNLMPAEEIVFDSLNTSIATVLEGSPNQITITPVGAGTTRIRGMATNGIVGYHDITVTAAPPPPVPTTVSVAPTTASKNVGQTQQFTATVKDQYGNPIAASVNWSSSAPGVATVNSSGLATAVAAGTAQITATVATNTSVKGTAAFTVTNPSPPPQGGIQPLPSGVSTNPTHKPPGMTTYTDRDMTYMSVASNDPIIKAMNWDSGLDYIAVNNVQNGYRTCEIVPQPGNEPFGQSTVIRQYYYPGMRGGVSPARMFTEDAFNNGFTWTKIYICDFIALDQNWQPNPSNVNKSAFMKWAGSDPGNFYWQYYGTSKNDMDLRVVLQGNWNNSVVNPHTGLDDSVFRPNCVNGVRQGYDIFRRVPIKLNQWNKIEIYADFGAGGYTGILKFWYNDELIMDYDVVNFIAPGATGSRFSTYSRDGTWGGGFGPILAPGFYLWWSHCHIAGAP